MNKIKFSVYIDESGIHKTTEHSSFVFVYVMVENKDFIQKNILEIERFLKIPYFHWSDFSTKHGWSIRKRFLEKVTDLPFTFKYVILQNPVNSNEELYNSLFILLESGGVEEIYIDGKQPKWFERKIKKNLRDRGLSIRKVITVNDENEPIIRLADALANLVRVYHDNPQKLVVKLFTILSVKNINETTRRKASGQGY